MPEFTPRLSMKRANPLRPDLPLCATLAISHFLLTARLFMPLALTTTLPTELPLSESLQTVLW